MENLNISNYLSSLLRSIFVFYRKWYLISWFHFTRMHLHFLKTFTVKFSFWKLLRPVHTSAECWMQNSAFRTADSAADWTVPHDSVRIPQCGTKKVKTILTLKNHIESHTMKNPHAEFAMRDAESAMRNPHAGRSEKITMVPHSAEVWTDLKPWDDSSYFYSKI